MSAWQPIETAPRDGTIFLAMWREHPQFVGWTELEPSRETIVSGPWWNRTREIVETNQSGWRVLCYSPRDDEWHVHGNFSPFTPTHWMPLPDPPT